VTLLQEANRVEDLPEGRGVLVVLDRTGDTRLIWNRNDPDEVDNARQTFDRLVKEKKFVAYKVGAAGEKGEVMRTFDSTAEKIILAPALRGG
jgi:hypothetical protein